MEEQITTAIIETINPDNGETLHCYHEMNLDTTRQIIESVHSAYQSWCELPITERTRPLLRAAELLRSQQHELAVLMANEMGKPLSQGYAEIEKCALLCVHFAEASADYLQGRSIKTNMIKSFVTHEPLGVVFGIMPWNFPYWQVFRFAIPAMMAGNGALLKHAPISTGTALEIERLMREAGFPQDLFRTLIISNDTAAEVMAHPHVAAVTFTGSVGAGRVIAKTAGEALKKTVLELGGSDAYLILHDADLAYAAKTCVAGRMSNSGQSCISPKRLIVVEEKYDEFIKLVVENLEKYKIGAPLAKETQCGPLARRDIRDHVHQQVKDSVAAGANLMMGGYIPNQPGFYYPPTLLTNVTKGMPAFAEEIFGPVISIIPARDEEGAIKLANDSIYGLGAAVFTQDIKRGEMIAARKLKAGTCVVNTIVASDPKLPFGGIKDSGYGRELSEEGMLSFVNTKTVNIQRASDEASQKPSQLVE